MAKAERMAKVRRRAEKTAKRLFDHFDRTRRSVLTDVCHEFYPLGVAGLERSCEEVADGDVQDDEHRLLTTLPLTMVRNGACGFKSHLTPNAGGWFRFRPAGGAAPGDEALDRLSAAVERAFDRSHAYDSLYKLYEHLLVAGFGCMLVTRHRTDGVRVRTLRLGTYALGVDDEGDVSRMARKFSWDAEKIVSAFGRGAAPEGVRRAAERGDTERKWTVWNLVEPNAVGDKRRYDETSRVLGLDDMIVYRSLYWLDGAKDDDPNGGVLSAAGFTVKPIVAPRLDRELGDVYGRGRGVDALCAARGAQSFQYDILNVSGLRGKPPLVVAAEFKDEGFRAGRGAVNYARFGEQSHALAYPVFPNPPDTEDLREDRRDALAEISDLFFNSAFATIDALKNNPGVKTATEVDALVRENMERLSPIVMNLERELLDPLVTAVAKYAVAEGFPPLMEEDLEHIEEIEVEYVSRLHMAAQARRIGDIDAWAERVATLAEIKPEVLDNIDADGAASAYAEYFGVPAVVLADPKEMAAKRLERAEAAKAQQQAAEAASVAQLAKVGGVPTDKGHLGGVLADAAGLDTQGGQA